MVNAKAKANSRAAVLKALITDEAVVQSGLNQIVIPNEKKLDELMGQASHLGQVKFTKDTLVSLLENLNDLSGQIVDLGHISSLAVQVNRLSARATELTQMNAKMIKVRMVLKEYHGKASEVSGLTAIISQGEETLKKRMGKRCPLCGGYIQKEKNP
jgi:hypothetical protein